MRRRRSCKEILKEAPQHVGARLGLGHVARRRGDRATALAYFEAAAALDPNNLPVKLEVAADLRELGRLDEAEAVLQEILKQAPQHVGARLGLGHVARRRGDRGTALAYFEAAAALDPNNLPVKLEVAADLRELGRLDEAEAVLQEILKELRSMLARVLGSVTWLASAGIVSRHWLASKRLRHSIPTAYR